MGIAARAMRQLSGVADSALPRGTADERPDVLDAPAGDYLDVATRFEPATRILWRTLRVGAPSCLGLDLIAELRDLQARLAHGVAEAGVPAAPALRGLVTGSDLPGVWNLGLDLRLVGSFLQAEDAAGLRRYLHAAVDALYPSTVGLNLPVLTVALVTGDALGGGFEAALAHDVIVVEAGTRLGICDARLGLPPGIAAFPLLARRIGRTRARRILAEGRVLAGEALQALGAVDLIAHPGQGERVVRELIAAETRSFDRRRRLADSRRRAWPLPYDELLERAEHWLEAALRLDGADRIRLQHLAALQARRAHRPRRGLR